MYSFKYNLKNTINSWCFKKHNMIWGDNSSGKNLSVNYVHQLRVFVYIFESNIWKKISNFSWNSLIKREYFSAAWCIHAPKTAPKLMSQV